MKAIIKNGKNKYISPIFAIKWSGWKSECIAFNSDFSKLQKLKMWDGKGKIERQTFIFEWEDFKCNLGDREGEEWIIKMKTYYKN